MSGNGPNPDFYVYEVDCTLVFFSDSKCSLPVQHRLLENLKGRSEMTCFGGKKMVLGEEEKCTHTSKRKDIF